MRDNETNLDVIEIRTLDDSTGCTDPQNKGHTSTACMPLLFSSFVSIVLP